MKTFEVDGLSISYVGPDITTGGTLPALFYFALSAKDSLTLDPFNQPVEAIDTTKMRVFSISVPGHDDRPAVEAFTYWKECFENGNDIITPLVEKAAKAIEKLTTDGVISTLGFAGLSRGVYIASKLAAKVKKARVLLGFAPMLSLETVDLFKNLKTSPVLAKLSLDHVLPEICDRTIRFYMGNNDTRTFTNICMDYILRLTSCAYAKKIRSIPIELFVIPSIGYQGHGTSKETFISGAKWIEEKLCSTSS